MLNGLAVQLAELSEWVRSVVDMITGLGVLPPLMLFDAAPIDLLQAPAERPSLVYKRIIHHRPS
jgi:hypothetical protein